MSSGGGKKQMKPPSQSWLLSQVFCSDTFPWCSWNRGAQYSTHELVLTAILTELQFQDGVCCKILHINIFWGFFFWWCGSNCTVYLKVYFHLIKLQSLWYFFTRSIKIRPWWTDTGAPQYFIRRGNTSSQGAVVIYPYYKNVPHWFIHF